MLVLTRQRGEDVIITMPDGRRLTVGVTDIRGDKVRIGFRCPPDVMVHRAEVQRRVDAENGGGST
jgi:carbon storage regulator CsrA